MKTIILTLICSIAVTVAKDDVPRELMLIQEQRAKKIRAVNTDCIKKLESLKKKYMRSGDLDAANQVAAMIKDLSPASDLKNSTTRWKWASGGELVLQKDGVCTHTGWKRSGTWKLNPDGSVLLRSEAGSFTIKFNEHGDGIVTHTSGSRTAITRK